VPRHADKNVRATQAKSKAPQILRG
jgi:hypothetical protein